MTKNVILLLLLTVGCSSHSSTTDNIPKVTNISHVRPKNHVSVAHTKLEVELLINLWLHLSSEKHRLQEMLDVADKSEYETINHFISVIEDQQKTTFNSLFEKK